MRRRAGSGVLAGVLAFLVFQTSACGEDGGDGAGSSTTDPADSLTVDEWADEVNEICRRTIEEVAGFPQPDTPEGLRAFLEISVDTLSEQLESIKALPLPEGREDEVSDAVATLEDAQLQFELALAALDAGNPDEALQLLTDAMASQSEVAGMREDLGLTDCEGALATIKEVRGTGTTATTAPS